MDLHVQFCQLLARIQGYLEQYLDKGANKFKDDLKVEEFIAFMTRCISEENADAESLQSLHNLLLASSGIVPLDETSSAVQSALAKLGGAVLPVSVYLSALPAGLAACLPRLLRTCRRPAQLRAGLVSACCERPAVWSAVPSVLAACLEPHPAAADAACLEPHPAAADAACLEPHPAAADAARLVALLEAAEPADARQAVAVSDSLLLLLERLLESPDGEQQEVAPLAAAAVAAATALLRQLTLSVWLEWAEQEVRPGGGSVQSTVAAALAEAAELLEEARREGSAGRLPPASDAFLETCRPYLAGRPEMNRSERLQRVAARDASSSRHLHVLLQQLDVQDEQLVVCLEQNSDLVSADDLGRLLEAVKSSAGQPSQLRDRIINVVVCALLKEPVSESVRRLTEHVLTTCPEIRSSTWQHQLRRTSAQLVGCEQNTISETSAVQMCWLLLQSPRALLQSVVEQATESAGKAAIMSALLPAMQRRLPLHSVRTEDNAGLTECLILDRLSEITDPKPFKQLSQLLTSAVGCGVTSLDQQLAEKVAALPSPRRLTLQLVQDLLGSGAGLCASWCCPLAQFSADCLDETLDMDTDAELMTEQRQAALTCIRLMEKVEQIDEAGGVALLASRCHPVTEQYLSRYLLRRPTAHSLLSCLTEDTAPPWTSQDDTLIKATLASYLPYFCADEWRALHMSLLAYQSGPAPLVGPAPAEHRPLARLTWYYGDLVTLWTVQPADVEPDQSLLIPTDRLATAVRAIAVQIKRTLETYCAADEYPEQLSAVFLPLTHMMTLLKDVAVRDPLDMLALYITAEFIKHMTSRVSEPRPAPEGPVSPCMDWQLEGMDTSAGVLSQFVVGCANIPSDSPVKKRVLQHISGLVLGSMAPQNGHILPDRATEPTTQPPNH